MALDQLGRRIAWRAHGGDRHALIIEVPRQAIVTQFHGSADQDEIRRLDVAVDHFLLI